MIGLLIFISACLFIGLIVSFIGLSSMSDEKKKKEKLKRKLSEIRKLLDDN